MNTYNIKFSRTLIETAKLARQHQYTDNDLEVARTIIYLSLLASEISMKAALQKAGYTSRKLKKLSHDHNKLLKEFSNCIISSAPRIRATRLRGVVITSNQGESTVGAMIEKFSKQATTYPSGIRYSNELNHYPVDAIIDFASKVTDWCEQHLQTIQLTHHTTKSRSLG